METAEQVSAAFGLGQPTGPLTFVQHTVSMTWQLTTQNGSFLVKQLWADDDPFWAYQLAGRMDYERLALKAGVPMPVPIDPLDSAYGYVGRVDGRGGYRVYEWLNGHPAGETDELGDWLGFTLATLHAIAPYGRAVEADWRWEHVVPPQPWPELADAADVQAKPWAPALRAHLGFLTTLSERLVQAWKSAADDVTSHRDIEPFNVLVTSGGPALIDWDSVGTCSATFEAGGVAGSFGYADSERTANVLRRYVHHGGCLANVGADILLAPVARRLTDFTTAVSIALRGGDDGRPEPDQVGHNLVSELGNLTSQTRRLTQLAERLVL